MILFTRGEEIRDAHGSLVAIVARDVIAGDDPFAVNNFELAGGPADVGDFMPEPLRRFIMLRMGQPYKVPCWRPSRRSIEFIWERAHGASYQSIASKHGASPRHRRKFAWVKQDIENTLKRMRHFGMSLSWGQSAE